MTQREIFFRHIAQTSDFPLALEIRKAKGIFLYGKDKKRYIDLISGISVSNIGHGNPRVLNAVRKQMSKHLHLMVYGEFVQSPQTRLAQALAATLPPDLNSVYFVNSGSEANEGALKLAKRYTGRKKILSFLNAYHGSSHGALSIGGTESYRNAFQPLLPECFYADYNSVEDLSKIDENTACVVVEAVQAEAGVRLPDPLYMRELRRICTEKGVLLIFDEVQTGFGRTGKFWGFEHYGIVPDIITTAKAMGGGMPLGAFIAAKERMQVLTNKPVLGHITTFGGHPVCCAASLAALDVIREGKLHEKAEEKGQLFKKLLMHEKIKEVRGCGLLLAVEFENFDILKKIIDKAIARGVLTDWFLYCDNAMRIAPPLIITEEQIKLSVKIILAAIDEAAN
jgi:acetylornithine/succinyldiaminopimelate/putrescine aminotransferase